MLLFFSCLILILFFVIYIFYSTASAKSNARLLLKKDAPESAPEAEVLDIANFQMQLMCMVKEEALLKITSLIKDTAVKLKITYQGSIAQNICSIKNAYRDELTLDLLEKTWYLLYGQFEQDDSIIRGIHDAIMEKLPIGFDSGDQEVDPVTVTIRAILREKYRRRVNGASEYTHGVKITPTQSTNEHGQKLPKKRKPNSGKSKQDSVEKGVFILERNSKNWMQKKHVAWLEKSEKKLPAAVS